MSKCWYCNEELLLGNNTMHIGICDKCYDEMFKTGDEFLVKMTNKISNLEAKLAESEKQVEFLKEENKINKKDADYYFDEYRLCKHQLAEKEKELENLNKEWVQSIHDWKEIVKKKDEEIETLTHQHEDKGE